eukprot:c7226_g1_i1.p1 GENE.c7226_g1_i1~~c7226_g1_i1.p1  ORF type:complete len:474 (+),score=97.83 c7226_g1_i1:35-1456(+)
MDHPYHLQEDTENDDMPKVAAGRRRTLFTGLLIGFLMTLMSGTVYAFGAFQTDLKKTLDLNQHKVGMLGIATNLGLYLLKPLSGLYYDTNGPRPTAFFGALFGGLGFIGAGMLCSISKHSDFTFVLALFAFTSLGLGSGLGYVTSLSTNAKNFDAKDRGKVVGMMASGFGLSATIVSVVYVQGLHSVAGDKKLPMMFFLLGAAFIIVDVLGALQVKKVAPPVVLATTLGDTENDSARLLLQEDWCQHPVGLIVAIVNLFRDARYWVIYLTFAVGTGCGLYLINNVGSMNQSLQGKEDSHRVQLLVVTLALCNCAGRVLVGWLSDATSLRRCYYLPICIAIMSATTFVSSTFTDSSLLFFTVSLVGVAYGGVWATAPTILSEIYGMTNFGKIFGITATAPALSSALFNSIAGVMYEHHSDGHDCYGTKCFGGSLVFSGAMCAGASVVSFILFRRQGVTVSPIVQPVTPSPVVAE